MALRVTPAPLVSPSETEVVGLGRPADLVRIDEVEVDLLLEGVYRVSGFDFRNYARSSIRRRLQRRVVEEGVATVSGLQEKVLHDQRCLSRLLVELSVNVTSMFRDPSFFAVLRSKVVPLLRTYPFIRAWIAGCSTGEEAYSLAVLLHENGLYERSRIYATDINEEVLDRARAGAFSIEKMKEYTANYIAGGGTRAFSEYYTAEGVSVRFHQSMRRNMVFAQHNLVSDRSFNEFNLILCRNVMIYFDKVLQGRVHSLLHDSLAPFGVLGLGHMESVRFSSHEACYQAIDPVEKLYRRVA